MKLKLKWGEGGKRGHESVTAFLKCAKSAPKLRTVFMKVTQEAEMLSERITCSR